MSLQSPGIHLHILIVFIAYVDRVCISGKRAVLVISVCSEL